MSISFSLDIKLKTNTVRCRKIIELFIQSGWNIGMEGKITYLPLHDNDMFDWTMSEKSIPEFMRLVDEKEKVNELIGVELHWANTNIGGDLLLYSGNDFSFLLNINTKYMQTKYKIPDFGWYAERIIGILKQEYHILEYSFEFIY